MKYPTINHFGNHKANQDYQKYIKKKKKPAEIEKRKKGKKVRNKRVTINMKNKEKQERVKNSPRHLFFSFFHEKEKRKKRTTEKRPRIAPTNNRAITM